MATKTKRTAGAAGVIVTGEFELDKKLSTMEAKAQKKVARKALRTAAKSIIVPDARAMVPEDTSDLRRSIKAKAMRRSRTRVGINVLAGDGFYKGNQYYSGFVEFGTKFQEADPFLRPAGYANADRIRNLIIKDLKKIFIEMAQ